jgi:hypothetical protein
MNYTVYFNGVGKQFTFNYLEKVGDLQSIIIESYRIKKEKLLYILWDTKILGIDIRFQDSLIFKNLFNATLFVVIDSDNQAGGSKEEYLTWLEEVSDPNQIIESHRQIMYHNILHNTWSSTSLNFMSVPNSENNTTTNRRASQASSNSQSSSNTRALSTGPSTTYRRTRPSTVGRPSLSNLGSLNNTLSNSRSFQTSLGNSTNSNINSGFNHTTRINSQPLRPNRPPPARSHAKRPARSPTNTTNSASSNGNQFQDLLSLFLSPSNSGQSSIFDTIMNMNLEQDGSQMDITFSTASYNIPTGNNFWDYLNGLESVPVTLSREMLDTLPTFSHSELPSDIKSEDTPRCTICLQDYQESDQVRVLLCKHYFHKECIDTWLSEQNVRCPLCRHDSRQPTQSNEGDDLSSR